MREYFNTPTSKSKDAGFKSSRDGSRFSGVLQLWQYIPMIPESQQNHSSKLASVTSGEMISCVCISCKSKKTTLANAAPQTESPYFVRQVELSAAAPPQRGRDSEDPKTFRYRVPSPSSPNVTRKKFKFTTIPILPISGCFKATCTWLTTSKMTGALSNDKFYFSTLSDR